MGNTIFIKDRKVCVRPLRSRIEALLKLEPPKTQKGCRSFAGMVNFLSMFCPELQKHLKPIYNLTRKGRSFIRGEEQQKSFEEIKRKLVCIPVLHMPKRQGRFHLYSDTSKFAAGSTLYQMQDACGVQHYVTNSLLYLQTIKEKYIAVYNEFITQLQIYAKVVRILAKGYLPISLINHINYRKFLIQ